MIEPWFVARVCICLCVALVAALVLRRVLRDDPQPTANAPDLRDGTLMGIFDGGNATNEPVWLLIGDMCVSQQRVFSMTPMFPYNFTSPQFHGKPARNMSFSWRMEEFMRRVPAFSSRRLKR